MGNEGGGDLVGRHDGHGSLLSDASRTAGPLATSTTVLGANEAPAAGREKSMPPQGLCSTIRGAGMDLSK